MTQGGNDMSELAILGGSKIRTEPYPVWPVWDQRDIDAVTEVIKSGRWGGYPFPGPKTAELARKFAEMQGGGYAVPMVNGTITMEVALRAANIGWGDEVIVPAYTFQATASAPMAAGAIPVIVDVDPNSYCLDPKAVERAITPKTRAIIPVHLYGQMADMDPIMAVANRHSLYVIEDAAQAIGAEYKGRRAGSIGHFGCFSFFPSKNLGAFGDGGMVTANDPALAHKAKLLRNHGAEPKYYHKMVGGNFRLDALQAAILRVKLPHLDDWSAGRQRNAAQYRKLFRDANIVVDGPNAAGKQGIVLPTEEAERRHIYNQFVIRSDRRDAVMAKLKERKIGTEIYYPVPLHLQECFAELGYQAGSLPHAELAAKETLALPIYPELTEAMQAAVVAAVAAAYDA